MVQKPTGNPMNKSFDIIIVGSGPAGVSAAFPLVENGLEVLLVDGGFQRVVDLPTSSFISSRLSDGQQHKWIIGEEFHALKELEAASPKLRAPTHEYVFRSFVEANRIIAKDFLSIGSMASGGLSNAWGCGVARLSPAELSNFPVPPSELDASYRTIAQRIGISGKSDDDLAEYFGLDEWAQDPIELDPLHQAVYSRYLKSRNKCLSLGFRLGRSRVAVISGDHNGRRACNLTGTCLWGCPGKSMYSSADELPTLRRYKNYTEHSGVAVTGISRKGQKLSVVGIDKTSGAKIALSANKVLLAAGTLASTRLVLSAIQLRKPVRLLSCPTAAFLLWLPRQLGAPRIPAFGLGQLSFNLRIDEAVAGFGSTFNTTGIPVSEFARHMPASRRYGLAIVSNLLSSCLVGNLFLPGDLSDAQVQLCDDDALVVSGRYKDKVAEQMQHARGTLSRAFRALGAHLLPGSFTIGRPGADIHYSGTLPMRTSPTYGETNSLGEVYGLDGVHVVDGSCLPTLPEKSHTLTIMANADRIGRALAASY